MDYLDIKALGTLAKELRIQAGLSQSEVADLVGSSQPNISAVENGRGTRYVSVAMNIIQKLSAYTLEGPFYCIQKRHEDQGGESYE